MAELTYSGVGQPLVFDSCLSLTGWLGDIKEVSIFCLFVFEISFLVELGINFSKFDLEDI